MTALGPKATWGTLHNQVRFFISDAPSVTNTWDDSQIIDGINFAIIELCKLTKATYVEKTKTVAATGLVALGTPGIAADVNYLALSRVNYLGLDLMKTTKKFLSMRSPSWETDVAAVGEPTRYWTLYNGNTIKLVKLQAAWNGTQSVTIGYIERPLPLAADGDTVDVRIQEDMHRHIKYAAASFLLQIDGDNQDFGKAEKLYKEFEALVKGTKSGAA